MGACANIYLMKKRFSVFPVIAISGLPRVGSMWSFNVARALIRENGFALVPDQVLKTDSEMFAIAESYLKSRPINTRCVIKVHSVVDVSRNIKVIRNYRELRDRLFSYYRFMRAGLDEQQVLEEVIRSLAVDSQYEQWPSGSILSIPFDSIEADSIELIRQIAKFMGLSTVDKETLRKINFEYSKQQVRRRIAEVEDHVFDQQGKVKHEVNPDAVIDGGFGRLRAYDVVSGFQSGHVTDYRPGDWKHLWTDRQKELVDDAILMAQHGRGSLRWQRKIGQLHKWIRSLI